MLTTANKRKHKQMCKKKKRSNVGAQAKRGSHTAGAAKSCHVGGENGRRGDGTGPKRRSEPPGAGDGHRGATASGPQ